MDSLPVLREGRVVRFSTEADLDSSIERYLSRGALAVRPQAPLQPLEQVEVALEADFLEPGARLLCEVVHLDPERALLRLLQPFDASSLQRRPAAPPPPAAAASDHAAADHALAPPRPGARADADDDDALMPPPHAGPAHAGPAQPREAAPARARLPRFDDGALFFSSLTDFAAAKPLLESGAAIPALPGPGARLDVAEAISIVVGGYRHTSQLTAVARRADDEHVAVKLMNRALTRGALPAVETGALAAGEAPAADPPPPFPDVESVRLQDNEPMPAAVGERPPFAAGERTPARGTPSLFAPPTAQPPPTAPPPPAAGDAPPPQAPRETAAPPTAIAAPPPGELTPARGTPAASPGSLTPAWGTPALGATPAFGTAVPVLPPRFVDGDLVFATRDDYRGAHEHLSGVGAVVALCDAPPSGSVELDVGLVVAGAKARGRVRCMIFASGPGQIIVQATDVKAWRPILDEIDAESQAMPRAPRVLALPRRGVLENPTTAAGILRLPVGRPPNEDDVAAPSAVLLLRWLRTQVGVHRLEISVEDQPLHHAVFVDGREVRAPVGLASLAKALSHPKAAYELVEIGKAPNLSTTGRTLHLIVEVIRALLARCSGDELQQAFPEHRGECPRAVAHVADNLGLPAQHLRFMKGHLHGGEPLEEVVKGTGVGARTAWDLLYVLELFNALHWSAADLGTKPRSTSSYYDDPLEGMWRSLEGKDHFTVLGLHWSSAPAEIPQAYQKLKLEYGPGGMKRGSNDEVADRIWARVEEAYKVLSDAASRRRYRKTTFNLVWSHQAQLLVAKAKLAIYRKDWIEARDILLAAEDISPSDEAAALLQKVREKDR